MIVNFEDITNHMAKLIQNDAGIQQFCLDNLGNNLQVRDNTILSKDHILSLPTCEINKGLENNLKHEDAKETRKSQIWTGAIIFIGDFGVDANRQLPNNAIETINGVETMKPADLMRILGRKAGELLHNKISCSNTTQGIYLSNYQLETDTYYEDSTGTVACYLTYELYKRNTGFN